MLTKAVILIIQFKNPNQTKPVQLLSNRLNFNSLIILLFIVSCNTNPTLQPGEGYVNVKGGKIWYRIVGSGTNTPLLLLHGGPGSASNYLNPLAVLSTDRPIIFIDQLGCGKSERISDTSLMTTPNFVDELEQLRQSLGLKEYYLYGHSWGTMLGMDYYLKYPKGIKALLFNSPLFSTTLWIKDADTLIATLPDSVQNIINQTNHTKNYNSSAYQQATQIYYAHFLNRQPQDSADLNANDSSFGKNVYEYMWGPSEFTCEGNLKHYDRLNDLSSITIPTLFIAGEYDEARPSTVQLYQSKVKGSKFALIHNSGHVTMHDNPKENIEVIKEFLKEIEGQ